MIAQSTKKFHSFKQLFSNVQIFGHLSLCTKRCDRVLPGRNAGRDEAREEGQKDADENENDGISPGQIRHPLNIHVLSRNGVRRNTDELRDEDGEHTGEQTLYEGLRVEDLRDIVLGGTDGPKDTDLLGPLEDGDIGDDGDHNARDDQRDGHESDEHIADGVDDLGDGRRDGGNEVRVRDPFRLLADLLVIVVNELNDGLLPLKVCGVNGDGAGVVEGVVAELLQHALIGVDAGSGELGHQCFEVLLAHHVAQGGQKDILVLHDVVGEHLLDLSLVHAAEVALHHAGKVRFGHIAHGGGDHLLQVLLGHAADVLADHPLEVFLVDRAHGLLQDGGDLFIAEVRSIVFDQLFQVRLGKAAHELLRKLCLLLVGQAVEIAVDEFPDHIFRHQVLEEFQEQVRQGLEQEVFHVGHKFRTGEAVRQKECRIGGRYTFSGKAEGRHRRGLIDEGGAGREQAGGEQDVVFRGSLLLLGKRPAGQDIGLLVFQLGSDHVGLRRVLEELLGQRGVVADPAADAGVVFGPKDTGNGEFHPVLQMALHIFGVFGLVDIDVARFFIEFGRGKGAEAQAQSLFVVELMGLVFDLLAGFRLFHHLVHVGNVEQADGVEDVVADMVVGV